MDNKLTEKLLIIDNTLYFFLSSQSLQMKDIFIKFMVSFIMKRHTLQKYVEKKTIL